MRAPYSLPKTFLGATKQLGDREVNITEVELDKPVDTGVMLRKLGSDLVPVYEEHAARIECGISLDVWAGMVELEKALIIARRRIAAQMRNLQTEAEVRQANREAKRK